jgi:hypothetical protein
MCADFQVPSNVVYVDAEVSAPDSSCFADMDSTDLKTSATIDSLPRTPL